VLIGRDPALAADIIRCANSAYFGAGISSSVTDAVQKIGLREAIRALNLAVARIASNRDLDCYGIHGADYWAECLFNGLFMQALARETGEADPDEAYTVGLLRFIGRLAINQTIDNFHCGIFWDNQESITQWELDSVGIPQSEAGALLLNRWHFPDQMVQGIGMQNTPGNLQEKNWLADALYFSSALLPQGVGRPFLAEAEQVQELPPIGSEFLHANGLTPDSLNALLRTTNRTFDEVRQNFGV
jgi:HD-like signal output (HDOD) protein